MKNSQLFRTALQVRYYFYSVFPFEGFFGEVFLSLLNSLVDLNFTRHAGSRGRTGFTDGSAFFAIVLLIRGLKFFRFR